jgi:hypothetical protein
MVFTRAGRKIEVSTSTASSDLLYLFSRRTVNSTLRKGRRKQQLESEDIYWLPFSMI